jgi:hypothetical protein
MSRITRRAFSTGAISLGASLPSQSVNALPVLARSNIVVNVKEFGALGDGITDDTEAFNRACRSYEPWSSELEYNIVVPSGHYRIDGTVYVRKGQKLSGEGYGSFIDASHRTAGATFVLGSGYVNGKVVQDEGGSPVGISNFRTLGGAGSDGFIKTEAQGFSISLMFMSAVGVGMEISGADGLISEILIDQCLSGIVFSNAQNISVIGLNIYSPNYGVTFKSSCNDIILSNCIFSYTKYNSVLVYNGSSSIKSVQFNGCIFSNNEQYTTFNGYLLIMGSDCDIRYSSCAFRNWSGPALKDVSGKAVTLAWSDCTFDSLPSNKLYSASRKSSVLDTGPAGNYEFSDCSFRNLTDAIVTINEGPKSLSFVGGAIINCSLNTISCNTQAHCNLIIKNISGLVRSFDSEAFVYGVLPWWPDTVIWRITAKGQLETSDGRKTTFAEEVIVMVTDTNNETVVTKSSLWKIPSSQNELALAVEVNLGRKPGKLWRQKSDKVETRAICVAISKADFNIKRLAWSAETA